MMAGGVTSPAATIAPMLKCAVPRTSSEFCPGWKTPSHVCSQVLIAQLQQPASLCSNITFLLYLKGQLLPIPLYPALLFLFIYNTNCII